MMLKILNVSLFELKLTGLTFIFHTHQNHPDELDPYTESTEWEFLKPITNDLIHNFIEKESFKIKFKSLAASL